LQLAVRVFTAVMYRVKYERCASLFRQHVTVCTNALPEGQVDSSCSSVIMPGNGQLLRVTGSSAPILHKSVISRSPSAINSAIHKF